MKYTALALALVAAPLFAQDCCTIKPAPVADCNTVTAVGSACLWPDGNPPGLQKYLGQIDVPRTDGSGTALVNITEPWPHYNVDGVGPFTVTQPYNFLKPSRAPFSIGGTYSMQSEDLDFSPPHRNGPFYVPNNHVSDGFTVFAKRQWSDWRGLEARGEVIRYSVFTDSLSLNAGQNHTYSATIGPVVQHRFGALTPYFTPQLGYLYQYRSGVDVGAAAGVDLRAGKRLTVRLGDMRYSWAAAQFVKPHVNPLHGRIEMSTGLYFTFGGRR